MKTALIMPCRGRVEQTVQALSRLLMTAGTNEWELYLVADGDDEVYNRLTELGYNPSKTDGGPVGYWKALRQVTRGTTNQLIVNLANDLLPGRQWLTRALSAYQKRFGQKHGIIGFNDGIHAGDHAAHFLVHRQVLLSWYGNEYWPVQYKHNFGDTEMVTRGIEQGLFAVAPWAVLYHNHPVTGNGNDAVYNEGGRSWTEDERLFHMRKARKWST